MPDPEAVWKLSILVGEGMRRRGFYQPPESHHQDHPPDNMPVLYPVPPG